MLRSPADTSSCSQILVAHPTLAILDGVPVVARPPKRPAGFPTDGATGGNISDSEAEDIQSAAKTGKDRVRDRAGPAPSDRGADARMRNRAGPPPPPSDDSRADKKMRDRAGPSQAAASKKGERVPVDKDARARQRAGPPPPPDVGPAPEDDRHKPHKRGVRGAKRKRGEVEEIIAEDPTAERAAARAGPPPPVGEPGVASDSDDSDAGAAPVERKKQKRAKRGKGSAAAERKREVASMDVDGNDLVRNGDEVPLPNGKRSKKDSSAGEATDKSSRKKLKTSVPALSQAWDAGSPALPPQPVVAAPAPAVEEAPVAKPERTSVVGIVDVRKKAGTNNARKATAKAAESAAPFKPAPKADATVQAEKTSVWGEGAGEAWGSGAGGGAWS